MATAERPEYSVVRPRWFGAAGGVHGGRGHGGRSNSSSVSRPRES